MSLQLLNQHSNYIKDTCSQLEVIDYQKRTLVSSFVRECKKQKIHEKLVIKESLHLREDEKCIPGCQMLENEYLVVSKLTHENIMSPLQFKKQYKGGCAIYFTRASCDAFQYFIERSYKARKVLFTMKEVREMLRSIASALKYLHQGENIAHNDIKLENILCFIPDDNEQPSSYMLTDFGYSYTLNNTENTENTDSTGINHKNNNSDNTDKNDQERDMYVRWKGRVKRYLSPEIINSINSGKLMMGQEKQSDIISLGFSLYILVFFDQMLSNNETEFSNSKKYNRIQKEGVAFLSNLNKNFINTEPEKKDELFDLILKMIDNDPCKRIDICGILNHPWLN